MIGAFEFGVAELDHEPSLTQSNLANQTV